MRRVCTTCAAVIPRGHARCARCTIPRDTGHAIRKRRADYIAHHTMCVHCGSTEDLTIDHVTPHSKGGADTESNWQTLCRPCNSRKGASHD